MAAQKTGEAFSAAVKAETPLRRDSKKMALRVAPPKAVEAFPGGGPPTKKSSEKRETPVAAQKAGKASRPAVDAGPPLEEIHEIGEDG